MGDEDIDITMQAVLELQKDAARAKDRSTTLGATGWKGRIGTANRIYLYNTILGNMQSNRRIGNKARNGPTVQSFKTDLDEKGNSNFIYKKNKDKSTKLNNVTKFKSDSSDNEDKRSKHHSKSKKLNGTNLIDSTEEEIECHTSYGMGKKRNDAVDEKHMSDHLINFKKSKRRNHSDSDESLLDQSKYKNSKRGPPSVYEKGKYNLNNDTEKRGVSDHDINLSDQHVSKKKVTKTHSDDEENFSHRNRRRKKKKRRRSLTDSEEVQCKRKDHSDDDEETFIRRKSKRKERKFHSEETIIKRSNYRKDKRVDFSDEEESSDPSLSEKWEEKDLSHNCVNGLPDCKISKKKNHDEKKKIRKNDLTHKKKKRKKYSSDEEVIPKFHLNVKKTKRRNKYFISDSLEEDGRNHSYPGRFERKCNSDSDEEFFRPRIHKKRKRRSFSEKVQDSESDWEERVPNIVRDSKRTINSESEEEGITNHHLNSESHKQKNFLSSEEEIMRNHYNPGKTQDDTNNFEMSDLPLNTSKVMVSEDAYTSHLVISEKRSKISRNSRLFNIAVNGIKASPAKPCKPNRIELDFSCKVEFEEEQVTKQSNRRKFHGEKDLDSS